MSLVVKTLAEATPYAAANHRGVRSVRLQGMEPDGPKAFWTGLSHFDPGGGAGPDSAALEKVYVVLSGHMTLIAEGRETVLGPMDSCCIGPGVVREIVNRGDAVVSMVVIVASGGG